MARTTLVPLLLCLFTLVVNAAPPPPETSASQDTIKKLIEALKDPDPDIRANCASALVKLGADCVEPLIEALKGDHADRRAGAAYTLGLVGTSARTALPALLDALKDDSVEVRRAASGAVAKLLPDKSKAPREPEKK